MIRVMTDTRVYLRSTSPAGAARPTVDREAKVIRGVIVAGVGPARGHGFDLDATSLSQIHELGNAASKGVRSNYQHPNACSDSLGSHLGRLRDFRVDGDVVRADMHFAQAAFAAPGGKDYGTYLMDLAEEDPEALGMSVVINHKTEKRLSADGKPERGEDGKELPPVVRIQKLRAVDFVGDPATDRALLSAGTDDEKLAQLAGLVDHFCQGLTPEQIETRCTAFFSTYLSNRSAMTTAALGIPAVTAPATTTAPAAATSVPPAAQPDQAATLAAAEEKARIAERARIADITALCEKAGKADLAKKLIEEGTSLAAARELVLEAMLTKQTILGADASSDATEKKATPEDKFKAEYAADAKLHARNGVSEAEYVAARMVDEGLATLAPSLN